MSERVEQMPTNPGSVGSAVGSVAVPTVEGGAPPPTDGERAGFSWKSYRGNLTNLRAYGMFGALVAIWVIFYLMTSEGAFISPRNLSNLARQSCITGILATGMTLIIVSGNIDLSVGSMVGLTGGVAAAVAVWFGQPLIVVLMVTLGLGLLLGLAQGYATAYLNIPSFIVTLAGLLVYRGMLKGLTSLRATEGGTTIGPVPDAFKVLGQRYLPQTFGWILAAVLIAAVLYGLFRQYARRRAEEPEMAKLPGTVGLGVLYTVAILAFVAVLNNYQGVPVPVLILAALAGLFAFIATRMAYGRRVYAVGGNAEAAHLSGIDVKRTALGVFVLMGVLSAVAGMVYTARVGSATADAGRNLELDAIASCVIGGTSLIGGRGTIPGALIGALIIASLDNGMSLMNVEDFYQDIIKGMILLTAVWIDVASKRK